MGGGMATVWGVLRKFVAEAGDARLTCEDSAGQK